jgi:hypothetical protein
MTVVARSGLGDFEEHDPALARLKVHPRFDALREEPRLQALSRGCVSRRRRIVRKKVSAAPAS